MSTAFAGHWSFVSIPARLSQIAKLIQMSFRRWFVTPIFKLGAPLLTRFVTDPKDPHRRLYDVDDEKTVLILGDWYHTSSKAILASGNIALQ